METTADNSLESNEIFSRIEKAIQFREVESQSPEAEVLCLVHFLMEDFCSLPKTGTNKLKQTAETHRSAESIEIYQHMDTFDHQERDCHIGSSVNQKTTSGTMAFTKLPLKNSSTPREVSSRDDGSVSTKNGDNFVSRKRQKLLPVEEEEPPRHLFQG